MTRIIAGIVGGRRLETPSGSATRPTSDRVREALFSAIESGFGSLDGARVLDLFAGSGAVGLEAVSRGAAHATLVESDRRTARLIERNAATLGLAGVRVVPSPVETFVASPPADAYDLIFLDPPYAEPSTSVQRIVEQVTTSSWWTGQGWIVVERSARDKDLEWPSAVEAHRHRKYGETVLWYGRSHA